MVKAHHCYGIVEYLVWCTVPYHAGNALPLPQIINISRVFLIFTPNLILNKQKQKRKYFCKLAEKSEEVKIEKFFIPQFARHERIKNNAKEIQEKAMWRYKRKERNLRKNIYIASGYKGAKTANDKSFLLITQARKLQKSRGFTATYKHDNKRNWQNVVD